MKTAVHVNGPAVRQGPVRVTSMATTANNKINDERKFTEVPLSRILLLDITGWFLMSIKLDYD
jgi:hypothetical protein